MLISGAIIAGPDRREKVSGGFLKKLIINFTLTFMKMKNKKLPALLVVGLFLSLLSCIKEEPFPAPETDKENPAVNLSHSGKADDLFGEITLTATAQDNEGIERIVFYVNGDSVGQATQPPFEIIWNSGITEDGEHTLMAVAYDKSNNKSEANQTVTVKNTLFTASITAGYIENHQKLYKYSHSDSWLYLTDENGKVIGEAKQMADGKALVWKRTAEFPSGTIYLNRLEYDNSVDEDSYERKTYTLYSYPDFHLKEALFKISDVYIRNPAGSVDITIHNGFNGSATYEYGTAFHRSAKTYNSSANMVNYKADLAKERESGFTTYGSTDFTKENRVKFFRWDELVAGESYSFNVNDFEPMDARQVSFPGELNQLSMISTGFLQEDRTEGIDLDHIYFFNGIPANSATTLFYADKIFPFVRTFISGASDNKRFLSIMNSKAPENLVMPAFSMDVTKYSAENFEVSPNGEFDAGYASFGYRSHNESESVFVRKIIYTGNSARRYAIPEIPGDLLQIYPQFDNSHEFKLNASNAWEYSALNSYIDFIEVTYSGSYNGPANDEFISLSVYPQNEGGRIQKAPVDPMARIEEEIMKTRGFFPY